MTPTTMWLAAVALFAAPVAGDMDPVNPPPPPLVTTEAWFDWYESLLEARLNAVQFQRDQTRYVSASEGDDSADGTTPATPWRSVSHARSWINSPNPDEETREVLFRRGDVWRVSTGITTGSAGVRFADYGDPAQPRPYFTGFTEVIEPNDPQWTPTGDGAYWRPAPDAVTWVREDGDADLDAPLSRQATPTLTDVVQGSWHWSESQQRLYVHPRNGDDPRDNGVVYEIALTTQQGFSVSGDLALIENLRGDGFGLHPTILATQQEAFQSRVRNDDQAVIRNCVSFYGASHIIAHNAGATPGAGGIATIIDCTAGFTKRNTAGETVFNTFAGAGGNQTIFHNCTVARGTLPDGTSPAKRSDPFFGHAAGGAKLGLTIVYGLRVLDHPHGSPRTGRFNDAPDAPTLADVRVFLVGTEHEGGENTGDQLCPLFYEGAAYVNCRYRLKPRDMAPNGRLQGSRVDGWWINGTLELDLSNQTGSFFALYRSSAQENKSRIWNSAIVARNVPDGLEVRIDGFNAANSENSWLCNSVLAKDGEDGSFAVTLPHPSPRVYNNAYWNVPPHPSDDGAVVLDAPYDADSIPGADSVFAGAGAGLPGGAPIEHDRLRRPRHITPPTIGPLEAALPADLNGDGVVDGADLAILLAQWGDGDGAPADLNGDGVVNGVDLAILLANWGG